MRNVNSQIKGYLLINWLRFILTMRNVNKKFSTKEVGIFFWFILTMRNVNTSSIVSYETEFPGLY